MFFFSHGIGVFVYVFEHVLENGRGFDISDKLVQFWKVLC